MKQKVQPFEDPRERRGISRREMVQKLVGGASSGIIASTVAFPQAAEGRSLNPVPTAGEGVKAGEWAPLFLDPHQKESLIVLAEIIVPGSTNAEVARFVDLLLSVDTLENRGKFIASLSAMDGEALRRYGAPVKDLTAARQMELLTIASKATPSQPPGSETSLPPGSAALSAPLGVLHDHFENLKALISKAYYSSEIGMRELGWSDNYFYETFPGCQDKKL